MHLIIDLIILAIIVLNIYLSAKNGFVKTVIEVAGFILAIIISISISTPIASYIYDNTVEPGIVSSAAKISSDNVNSASGKFWDVLPDFIKSNAETNGLSSQKISESFNNKAASGIESAASQISQTAVKPIFVKTIGLAISAVLFIILMIVVKFTSKTVNRLFSFSIIGKLNSTLGGIVGFIKGVLVAIAVCMIINIIVSFTQEGVWIFTRENIDKTYIFNFLAGIIG